MAAPTECPTISARVDARARGDEESPRPPRVMSFSARNIQWKTFPYTGMVWTLSLAAFFLLMIDSGRAEVMCYECAWQGSSPLPSTADGVSDVCRPPNFNVNVVHKIKCANGCITQALYEFEADPSPPPRGGITGSVRTNRTRPTTMENMTFYFRGCQKHKKTRESCENKSFQDHVHAEECACLTDFCNGEKSGASSRFHPGMAIKREEPSYTYFPNRLIYLKNYELIVLFVLAQWYYQHIKTH